MFLIVACDVYSFISLKVIDISVILVNYFHCCFNAGCNGKTYPIRFYWYDSWHYAVFASVRNNDTQ